MARKNKDVNNIVGVATSLYNKLKASDNESLTKNEVASELGVWKPYYSQIVTGLATIGKIRKKPGRTGGIVLNKVQGMQPEIVENNRRELERHFSNLGIDFEPKTRKERAKPEKDMYEPLRRYLEESGVYNLVENRAASRKGKKWENVDLVAVKYTSLSYHVGVFPRLTGIEVKTTFPSITHVQQAASYLRYCTASYLCFLDHDYTGKNFEELMTKLRDEGIWDVSNTFGIGLIVAFYAQERSKIIKFQIIKEAPESQLEPTIVEEGIDLLLSKESKKELTNALQEQIEKFK